MTANPLWDIGDHLKGRFSGSMVDWLEANLTIPHSARSSKFSRAVSPWLNDIFEDLADDRVTQLVVRACTGGGKSTLVECFLPFAIAEAPGGMLMVGQNDDMVKEFAESRLIPLLEACPPVAKLFPGDRHLKRKTSILFPHCSLFLAGANISSLQEKSMRYCIGDEVWRWKQDMIRMLKARHHDRARRKTVLVTQGWDHDHDLTEEWNSGEVFNWGTTCAGCDRWHPYLWTSIKYDEAKVGGKWDWQALAESVRHECPHCGFVTRDTIANRRAMSDRGSWQSQGGNFVRGHRSRTWSALAVYWIEWAALVRQWCMAMDDRKGGNVDSLRTFKLQRLAEVWKAEVEELPVNLEASDYAKADYANGEPVANERARTMGVDRQKDGFYVVCRVWRTDNSSMLIYEGRVYSTEELRALQLRLKVPDALLGMDAAGWMGVASFDDCAKYNWTGLVGSDQDGFIHSGTNRSFSRYISPAKWHKSSTKPVRFYHWSNNKIKDQLSRLRAAGPPTFEIPRDISALWVEQMQSEVLRETVNTRTKRTELRWEAIRGQNHFWDAECMCLALANILGLWGNLSATVDKVDS